MRYSPAILKRGCAALVRTCADVRAGDRVLIITEKATSAIGLILAAAAGERTAHIAVREIAPLGMHGGEPPGDVAREMRAADVIFGLTRMSMAHTKARLAATNKGVRYLSLPDYSFAVLGSQALRADFRKISVIAKKLEKVFTQGSSVLLTTRGGTRLSLSIKGRRGYAAPGWCAFPGALASPPDAETNVALVEDASEGVLVVDGSIPCPEFGLLKAPITLSVRAGAVVGIKGPGAAKLTALFRKARNKKARVLAELGIGLNPKAELCGRMLEDEGCRGTCHIGIGSNSTIGGKNTVGFHLDHVIKSPDIFIDRKAIMRSGRLLV